MISREELNDLYINKGFSTHKIGSILGINPKNIYRQLQKQGIQIRKPKRLQITKEELTKLYWDDELSLATIAKNKNAAFQSIHDLMVKWGIKRRPYSTKGLKFYGRKLTQEQKDHLRIVRTGTKVDSKTRLKISKTLKDKKIKAGENSNWWKGGRFLQEDGYVFVYAPDSKLPTKRVHKLEHRHVMEKHLGRAISSIEHIHHINGNKSDNRIENLKLVSNYEHAMIHWSNEENRRNQSERLKKIRANKFWSTRSKLKS